MGILKQKHRARRSYDLFSNFNHFIPDISGTIILLAFLLAGAILGNLVTAGILVMSISSPAAGSLNDYAMLIAYPIMFIPAMIYASHKSRRNSMFCKGYATDSSNFGKIGGWWLSIMVAVATIATSIVTEPVQLLLPEPPEWFEQTMDKMLTGTPFWVTLVSVSVFAPLFEEWLCRGMILRGLLHKMKPGWAMVVSSAIFGLIHLNPWQAIPAFCLGMLFAYVYYRTGSLKLTMLMHCTNNTMAAVLSQSETLKDIDGLYQLMDKWQYAILWIAGLFIIAVFIRIIKRNIPMEGNQGNCDVIELPE